MAVEDLFADRELLRRVLQNLIDSCIKYGPRGGSISIDVKAADAVVRICVADDGEGVPEQFRATIFEKYARVERHPAERTRESRGLGLRFCRVAVEAHGGRI